MRMRDIYEKSVEVGMAIDWRGPEAVLAVLDKARSEAESPGFDADRLWNPYGDTRIAWGDPDVEVTSVVVGIEIHAVHLVQAAAMRAAGVRVDAAISHHMSCINRGLYYFDDILAHHVESLAEVGVPRRAAEEVVAEWTSTVPCGWKRDTVNAARNLGIPLMNIHTPCDLFHVRRIRETFARMADATRAEIAAELTETTDEVRLTPHEQYAVIGDGDAPPGKVYVPIGAGWGPTPHVFRLACDAGVDTAVLVNPSAELLAMARRHRVGVLSVPHNSNDCYGINRMLDAIRELGPLTVHAVDEFFRVERPA